MGKPMAKTVGNWKSWREPEKWVYEEDEARSRSAWDYSSLSLHYKDHVHYFQPNDGDLDRYGRPMRKWVYVRCVSPYRRKDFCLLKQTRLTPQQYTELDRLGFIVHVPAMRNPPAMAIRPLPDGQLILVH